jgi:RNA polymerase sigma-70 factor (ECF subfamily)
MYSPLLLTAVRRYIHEENDAQDVLQTGMILILDHLPRFQYGLGSFEGWMRRIVVHEALKLLKKKGALNLLDVPLESLDGQEMEVPPDVYQKMNEAHLLELIARLPDRCRAIFNLYALEDYSHEEIGRLLNINESTSRAHLARARALLRKMLEPVYNNQPKAS